jgi:hypothetical protein
MSAHWALCSDSAPAISTAEKRVYVIMKKSPEGNRQWRNKDGHFVLLRAHAARFTAAEAAPLLVDGAVMESAP